MKFIFFQIVTLTVFNSCIDSSIQFTLNSENSKDTIENTVNEQVYFKDGDIKATKIKLPDSISTSLIFYNKDFLIEKFTDFDIDFEPLVLCDKDLSSVTHVRINEKIYFVVKKQGDYYSLWKIENNILYKNILETKKDIIIFDKKTKSFVSKYLFEYDSNIDKYFIKTTLLNGVSEIRVDFDSIILGGYDRLYDMDSVSISKLIESKDISNSEDKYHKPVKYNSDGNLVK